MTHAFESMTAFINGQIETIEHTLRFTAEHRENWKDRQGAVRYLHRSIRETKEQGFGALIYAKIYERTITPEQYDELISKLNEAYFDADRRAFEIIL